ncbi:MAG TPA: hypothetical protein VLY45_03910, partial [Nitrospiria bacterium]|nr:hypothetical protein [Nitrospiria bacterium]
VGITGLNVTFDPNVSMGVHVFGGVDLGVASDDGSDISVASGGVDSTVNLLNVSLPVTADVKLNTNLAPASCSLGVEFDLKADVTISSAGGEIDLVATLGPCPFCGSASAPLLKWDPILSTTVNLFTIAPTTLASVPLPVGLCTQSLIVTVGDLPAIPVTGGTYTITGTATAPDAGPVNCSGVTWSVSPAEAAIPNGCSVSIHFFNGGAHTITMTAVDHITDQFGRIIAEHGAASKTITVAP